MQRRITRFTSPKPLTLCWLFLGWMAALGVTPSAFGQAKRTISGRVTDAAREPLVGVAVTVKGTSTGTATDASGQYTLSSGGPGEVLVLSMIGMSTQEIPAGSQSEINVTLQPDTKTLNEVVVIGYGTSTRKDLNPPAESAGRQSNPVLPGGQQPVPQYQLLAHRPKDQHRRAHAGHRQQ